MPEPEIQEEGTRNRSGHFQEAAGDQAPGEHAGNVESEKRAVALPGTVTYEKPREDLTDNEKAGVDGLAEIGISPTVKPEDPTAPANIDLEIGGQPWEMKNVTNISSVSNQFNRIRAKWGKLGIGDPIRAVFSTEGAKIPFAEIVAAIDMRRHAGEEFMVLSETGELVRF